MYLSTNMFHGLIVLILLPIVCKSANSHWVVTQDGKINKQAGSPFDLLQPHNLFALIEQERRVAKLHFLHQSLLHQKHEFQEIIDLDGYLTPNPLPPHPMNCDEVRNLWNQDLSVSTVVSLTEKKVNHDDYLDPAPLSFENVPHCSQFSDIESHESSPVDVIKKILNNEVIVGKPEPTLVAPFYLQQMEFGNSVHQALQRNSTSWVIYHLATIYWRSIGNSEEAMGCIKRLFQFCPKSAYDLPLLHLTNILHRSQFIHESLIPLKDAIQMFPESGVLFYTLGKIYISLGFLSQASRAFQTSLLHDYRYDHTHMLLQSIQCEMSAKGIVHDIKNKIKLAYEQLKEVHNLLGDIFQHQVAGSPLVLEKWIQLLYRTSYQYNKNNQYNWIHKEHYQSKHKTDESNLSEDFQGILVTLLKELSILDEGNEGEIQYDTAEYINRMDLEAALEGIFVKQNGQEERLFTVSNKRLQINNSNKDEISSSSSTSVIPSTSIIDSSEPAPSLTVKIFDPSVATVDTLTPPPYPSSSTVIPRSLSNDESICPNMLLPTICLSPISTTTTRSHKSTQQSPQVITTTPPPSPSKVNSDSITEEKKTKYTEAYRQMEFVPYNALPPVLEEFVFSVPTSIVFNDPHWPNKRQCLELVEDASDHLPRFTGTFLSPEARGVKFKELIVGPPDTHENLHLPRCGKVYPLPYSMAAMDHLVGVSDRLSLEHKNISAEVGLKQLLIETVEDATGENYSFEQAADKLYSTLKEHKYHWALYNLASIYWRTLGDGYQSIECLRRAIDLAQIGNRDIGYIGLASVLHRHGYLEDAIITGRAALDIRPISPVGHYTLAGIYLTCGDLVATNLHLRVVLNNQPNFKHALSALKLVRCSLKFKQEQKVLEQKQHLLLAQQQLAKQGEEPTQENLQKAIDEVKTKLKKRKDELFPSEFVGEDAIRYIIKTAVTSKQLVEERVKTTTTKVERAIPATKVEPSPSLSREQLHKATSSSSQQQLLVKQESLPSSTNPSSAKEPAYKMEFMAKENEREEELRKKWPENLPWPSLEDCKRKPPPQYMVFTSTWLSVTAKKFNITNYMDFNILLNDASLQPTCDINFELSEVTLNHFEGMYKPALLDYIAEKGLEEVLCKLSGSYHSMDEMATRMRLAMTKNSSNWVISNLAALYWRIVGNGEEAIQCLKHALHHSPPQHRDVAYVSLANVLYRSGYYENAASSMQLALETSPNLVVNHFTMANVLAGQGYYREAAGYYELVLYHQPEFGPASDRLRSVRCMIVLGENNISLKHLHHDKQHSTSSRGKKSTMEKMKDFKKDISSGSQLDH